MILNIHSIKLAGESSFKTSHFYATHDDVVKARSLQETLVWTLMLTLESLTAIDFNAMRFLSVCPLGLSYV